MIVLSPFFLLETVNAGWASGDGDLSCFFLFFQWRCRLGHEHVGLLVVFVVSDLHYRLSVLSYRGSVEGSFVLAPPAFRSLIVLREVVVFNDRGGQVSARLLCPRLVVLIVLAVGGGTYFTNVEGGSTSR